MLLMNGVKWLLCGVVAMLCLPALAQKFPSGDVRIMVGYAPGGGTDAMARLLATRVQAKIGVTVVVENRPGALGQIAGQFVSRQLPDGKILQMTASSPVLISPHIQHVFHPIKELTAVTLLTRFPGLLVVPSSSAFNTIEDVVAEARRNPGKLSYGTSGTGSMNHLAAEMLNNMAKINMVHIPYQGSGPAVTALLGKHVDMVFAAIQSVIPRVRSGEFRALGVDSAERSLVLPDVRSIREAGYPDYGVANWIGLFAPPKMSDELSMQIRNAFVDALKTPEVQKFVAADGQFPVGSTSQEFRQELVRDFDKMGDLVRPLGLK